MGLISRVSSRTYRKMNGINSPTSSSTASTNYEEKMVHLFNHLLQKCKLDNIRPLNSYKKCNLTGLTEVYRAILTELPKNFIKNPENDDDKVKNVQGMINTIALDLEVDLSYIDAGAIVMKEAIHLHNFVEILDGLLDFLEEKEESEEKDEEEDKDVTLEIKNEDFI